MPSPLLEVRGLCAGYGDAIVLDNVSLDIAAGSITAIIGSNGAGKTTLMRVIAGLLKPNRGIVALAGADLAGVSASARVERGLSLVPEGRLVFADMTIEETLKVGAFTPRARAGWRPRMDEMFAMFPRLAERRRQHAGSLSGGEQQMLVLARGLMSRPTLLLLDEPSLGLAPVMADYMFESVLRIRDTGVTICLVEQDVRAALSIADRAYVVEHGEIVATGNGLEMLETPQIRENFLGI
jgi:branched-chain amino acid transport system ATP-binding protein